MIKIYILWCIGRVAEESHESVCASTRSRRETFADFITLMVSNECELKEEVSSEEKRQIIAPAELNVR